MNEKVQALVSAINDLTSDLPVTAIHYERNGYSFQTSVHVSREQMASVPGEPIVSDWGPRPSGQDGYWPKSKVSKWVHGVEFFCLEGAQ